MTKPRRHTSTSSQHRYPRTARLSESLREVIAEELTRIVVDTCEFLGDHLAQRLAQARCSRVPMLRRCRRVSARLGHDRWNLDPSDFAFLKGFDEVAGLEVLEV